MSKKKTRDKAFSSDQERRIVEVARKVFDEQFKGKPAAQVNFGKALGNLSQPSVSALLKGTYVPGIRRSEYLAQLAGYNSLKDMIGTYMEDAPIATHRAIAGLEKCIDYHGTEHWPAWVIAAARAGAFGYDDAAPTEWAKRLDKLAAKLPQ